MMPEIKKVVSDRLGKFKNSLNESTYKTREAYRIINDLLLTPSLAGLIEESGLVHSSEVVTFDSRPMYVRLCRERVKGQGFWNAVGRFFGVQEVVLDLHYNGQLWMCNYYRPYYYLISDRLKEFYYEYLAKDLGNKDFVIMNK